MANNIVFGLNATGNLKGENDKLNNEYEKPFDSFMSFVFSIARKLDPLSTSSLVTGSDTKPAGIIYRVSLTYRATETASILPET